MSNALADFVRARAAFSGKLGGLEVRRAVPGRLLALFAAVAGLMGLGCGTPTAILVISAPTSAVSGSPFTITVTAMAGGSRDTMFNSDVKFTSSDGAASLPAIYTFTAADAGSHTFTNGVTLRTAGTQSIAATVTVASSITGSTNVMVTAAGRH